jgi:asparagine synthase (glutamine-hydrolysing)
MSAFAGVLYADRKRPAPERILASLRSSLSNFDGDDIRTFSAASIAMVYRAVHTTVESHKELQPLVTEELVILFDGRLDNRGELLGLLGIENPETTDVELVSLSFRRWSSDCFARLVGDFAIAIWDIRTRQLVLARDPFGIRKLFYSQTQERFLWSTDTVALLNTEGVTSNVDENFVGLSLAYLPDDKSSPFRDINVVRPGSYLSFKNGICHSVKIWGLSTCLDYQHDRGMTVQEHFRMLLTESIRTRLRADRPVTAELSGGLDSSTIVCLASKIIAEGSGDLASLNTLSYVYDRARQSDERPYITLVEQFIGRRGLHIREDDDPILSRWPDPKFCAFPNRMHCFGGAVHQTQAVMNRVNSRVLLSGLFGDQLLISSHLLPYESADLFRRGNFGAALKACLVWSTKNRLPLLPIFWHAAVRPNLASAVRRPQRYKGFGPRISAAHYSIPVWINRDFARRTMLEERVKRIIDGNAGWMGGSSGVRFANLMECVGWFGSGYSENQTSGSAVEMRYPFLHRPLVEFLISLPYRELSNDTSARYLHRTAMRGLIPEQIRLRTDKRGPTEALLIAVNREWERLLPIIRNSVACEMGFVSRDAILAEAVRWRGGQMISDMLRFLALEMWLRAINA